MTTKIYIHIGTHKTGTTALQQTLIKKTQELRSKGVKYINLFHFAEAQKLMTLTKYDESLSAELTTFFNAQKDSHIDKYIVCCEYLSGDPKVLYSNNLNVAKILFNALKGFDEKKIFMILRRQDQFIQSIYTQYLHQGEELPLAHFLNPLKLDHLKWTNFISVYESVFGRRNVSPLPYDKKFFEHQSLLSVFFKFCEIDLIKCLEVNNINTGYNEAAIRMAKACHPYLEESDKKILRRILQRHFSKSQFYAYQLLDEEQKLFLHSYFKSDNATLFSIYFKDAPITQFTEVEISKTNSNYNVSRDYPMLVSYLIKEINSKSEQNKSYKLSSLKSIFKKAKRKLNNVLHNPYDLYKNNNYLKELAKSYNQAVILGSAESVNKLELTQFKNDFVITMGNFYEHPEIKNINPKLHIFAASHPPITQAVLTEWWTRCNVVLPKNVPLLIEKRDKEVAQSVFKDRELFFYSYGGNLPVDFTKPIMSPWSVTIVALQLAIYCRIKTIGILGVNHDWQCIKPYTHFYDRNKPSLEYYLEKAGIEISYEKQKQPFPKERLYREYELYQQYEKLKYEANKLNLKIFNYDPYSDFDVFDFYNKNDLLKEIL